MGDEYKHVVGHEGWNLNQKNKEDSLIFALKVNRLLMAHIKSSIIPIASQSARSHGSIVAKAVRNSCTSLRQRLVQLHVERYVWFYKSERGVEERNGGSQRYLETREAMGSK